jgi:hypothetical protein
MEKFKLRPLEHKEFSPFPVANLYSLTPTILPPEPQREAILKLNLLENLCTANTLTQLNNHIKNVHNQIVEDKNMIILLKSPAARKKPTFLTRVPAGAESLQDFLGEIILDSSEIDEFKNKLRENSLSKERMLQILNAKKTDDALKSLFLALGTLEILWNKMIELELLTLFKYKKQKKHQKYPQLNQSIMGYFQDRGKSYLNIINLLNIVSKIEEGKYEGEKPPSSSSSHKRTSSTSTTSPTTPQNTIQIDKISHFEIKTNDHLLNLIETKFRPILSKEILNNIAILIKNNNTALNQRGIF